MITAIIRKLPKPVEFCLVLLACFWWGLYGSFVDIAKFSSSTPVPAQAHYTGIGVELGQKNNKIIIVQVLPNTTAAEAGLSSGNVVQQIDGIPTDGKPPQQCADLVRGPAGSKVKFELVDPTRNQTNTVELTRGMVQGTPPPVATVKNTIIRASFELFGLAVMFWIARVRGWPLGAWGFRPSWKLTGAGVLLFLVMTLVMMGLTACANRIFPGIVRHYSVSYVSWTAVALFSALNGVFEETVETGYFIQSLQKYGAWSAVLASACFRTFLHLYHGPTALIIIFPFGLVFGFVYWKWRRLWPLFVAHMLFDVFAYIHEYHAA
jgi:membrane protease YdiL (CAAX protease family)